MGWAGGSEMFGELITVTKRNVPDPKKRGNIYKKMINVFRDQDWDTEYECVGMDPAFDKELKKIDPDLFEDDEG